MSDNKLEKVLLIGAGGDIGKEIQYQLEDSEYEVICTTKSELDLSNDSSISKFLSGEDISFNHLVLAAAINNPKDFLKTNENELNEAIKINFLSYLALLKSLIPQMIQNKNRSITFISSLFGFTGRKGRLPYVSSKHAMLGLVRTLAVELGPLNIRVNAISPGFIDTKMTRRNLFQKELSKLKKRIPLSRLGNPEDVAQLTKFLISPKASYITGVDIIVDGGFLAGGFYEN